MTEDDTKDADDGQEEGELLADPPVTALEPPARIGILGAGPVGIEAALYARFLGYEVIVWEKGELAEHVGVAPAEPTEFGNLTTPLGTNALSAQSEAYAPRDATEVMSADDWKSEYLLPLAKTDLIRKQFHTQTAIESVVTSKPTGDDEDAPATCFTVRAEDGKEWNDLAAIIDTAGPKPFYDEVVFNADAIASGSDDKLVETLQTTILGYYVLGAKSWGKRAPEFTAASGHAQIRALFSLIGDRENLNLYL